VRSARQPASALLSRPDRLGQLRIVTTRGIQRQRRQPRRALKLNRPVHLKAEGAGDFVQRQPDRPCRQRRRPQIPCRPTACVSSACAVRARNRRLNHAIHMAAVTQVRQPHSEGRAYYDKKLSEGKTRKEALRALKRQVSDAVFTRLRADARPTAAQSRDREGSRRTTLQPARPDHIPATGSSGKPLPGLGHQPTTHGLALPLETKRHSIWAAVGWVSPRNVDTSP
jgi:hypothetical protein